MKIIVNFFNYRNLKPITLSALAEEKLVVHEAEEFTNATVVSISKKSFEEIM